MTHTRAQQHDHDGVHVQDGHQHRQSAGVRGLVAEIFSPHSHDAVDSVDDAPVRFVRKGAESRAA